MEQNSASLWKSSATSGVFLGIVLILVSVVYYVTGNMFAKSSQWVGYAVMAAGIVLAQLSYRKALGGFITYGQALSIGVLTMAFASLLTGIYTYLLYEIIDPSLQEKMKIFAEEQMVKSNYTEEQIEAALKVSSKLQSPGMMFVMSILGGTFIGLVFSLITSIFVKKKPSEEIVE